MQLFSRSLFRISALAATLAGAPALHATSVVNGFNVVTLGNFASSNSDLQRTLAMGQNLTLSGSVQQWHGVWQSISGKRHCDERGRLRGGVRDDGRRVSLGFFGGGSAGQGAKQFSLYALANRIGDEAVQYVAIECVGAVAAAGVLDYLGSVKRELRDQHYGSSGERDGGNQRDRYRYSYGADLVGGLADQRHAGAERE